MMESPPVTRLRRTLSTAERIELIRTLNELPVSQLLELEFALNVPKGIVPPSHEMQGIRTRALLDWVEGSTGTGWERFLTIFTEVTGIFLRCQSQRLKVVIEGDISGVDSELLLNMLAEFQDKADAPSLKISSIKAGSIELTLQGTPEDLKRLKQLIDSGELPEVAGKPIREAVVFFDFRGADLSRADLREAKLSEVDLRRVNLRGADLRRADLTEADLTEADLRRADFRRAKLREADFSRADLRGGNLSSADLRRAKLGEADLRWADLSGAILSGADLIGADLRGAVLIEATLSRADLRGAVLIEANFSGADLKGAKFGNNLGLEQVDKVDLIERGAMFRDSPDSDVPVLV